MPPAFDLTLHIGAHKTATSHFQRSLRLNRALLADFGTDIYVPKDLRNRTEGIWDLVDLDGNREEARNTFTGLLKDGNHLFLSEENLLRQAHPLNGAMPGVLYPYATEWVRKLSFILPETRLTLAISIRDYARFYRSLYAQRLLAGHVMSFEGFLRQACYPNGSWLEMLTRLVSLRIVKEIVLWRFEDYGALRGAILQYLFPRCDGSKFVWSDRRLNQTLSQRAMAELTESLTKDELRQDTQDNRKMHAQDMRKLYPVGDMHSVWDPWSAQEREASTQRYARDVSQIAQLAKVTYLTP
ncbi:MAG: hypothetical protein AAGD04_15460 [Pseudomonadota bacterium]